MKFFLRWGLPVLAVAIAPAPVLAQVRYEMLTLAEAAYLYSGLALQAILRNSSLNQLPQVIMVCCTIWLIYRRVTSARPQPIAGIIAYLVSCSLILVLFWPEAAPRFFGGGGVTIERVTAVGITSHIPRANSMPRINAAQSGMVPVGLRADTVVPRALHLILSAVTEMPLLLAQGIHAGGMERPFSRVPVMARLCGTGRNQPAALPEGPHAGLLGAVLHAGPGEAPA